MTLWSSYNFFSGRQGNRHAGGTIAAAHLPVANLKEKVGFPWQRFAPRRRNISKKQPMRNDGKDINKFGEKKTLGGSFESPYPAAGKQSSGTPVKGWLKLFWDS